MYSSSKIDVYLEIGKKRTFAGAINWPGWCRSSRDEASALAALLDYGARYAQVLSPVGFEFKVPSDTAAFNITERLQGNVATDFGAPEAHPLADAQPTGAGDLQRMRSFLKASWQAFDAAVRAAEGLQLRLGPRGGGRDMQGIIRHVLSADGAYLRRIGWKYKINKEAAVSDELLRIRETILEALPSAVKIAPGARGPRGGVQWTLRYFLRRACWHVLDHAWEIEDRIDPDLRTSRNNR